MMAMYYSFLGGFIGWFLARQLGGAWDHFWSRFHPFMMHFIAVVVMGFGFGLEEPLQSILVVFLLTRTYLITTVWRKCYLPAIEHRDYLYLVLLVILASLIGIGSYMLGLSFSNLVVHQIIK
mgnify:CR=1 FL=1|tara:strand:+ start:836 stop:1201 length:366 start_codon:yes stop_codon:yes gene_type:complete